MRKQVLTFNCKKYTPYHYAMSAEGIKILYTLIRESIMKGENTLLIKDFSKNDIDYLKILVKVLNDSPFIFWVQSKINYWVDKQGTHLNFYYNNMLAKKDEYLDMIFDKASWIFNKYLKKCRSKYEAALAIHDYLISTVTYDHDSLPMKDMHTDVFSEAHSLIGPLLRGKGVCEGISDAYSYLLSTCGIKATTVFGEILSGGQHAWNIIRLDGEWYHVDVTWDVDETKNCHWYFGLNDSQITITRKYEGYVSCNGSEHNYMKKNGTYFVTTTDLKKYLSRVRRGTKELFCEEMIDEKDLLSTGYVRMVSSGYSHWLRIKK